MDENHEAADHTNKRGPNYVATISLILAIGGFYIETFGLNIGAVSIPKRDAEGIALSIGIMCLLLGIWALIRVATLRSGRGVAIIAIILSLMDISAASFRPMSESRLGARLNQARSFAGRHVPPFTLTGEYGQNVTDTTMRGTAYVLYFNPHVEEMTTLDQLFEQHNSAGLEVFAVVRKDLKEDMTRFKPRLSGIHILTYSNGFSARPDSPFLFEIGQGFPETLVVGKDGVIIKVLFEKSPKGDTDVNYDRELAEAVRTALTTH